MNKSRSKIKVVLIQLIDCIFAIAYGSIAMPLIGWFLDTSSDWGTVTFIEFFDGKKWWLNIFVASLFYIPVRLLLKDELWKIIFREDEKKLS